MELGLYNLKYPARKLIQGLLPQFRDTDPNHISLAMLPVGLLVAAAYWLGAQGFPWLYLLAIALIFLRMFLGTLDGLVATHFGKGTPAGEMLNRLAPELCDVFYLVALALARHEWRLPGILALGMAWLVTFAGLVGATIGRPTQSVGPTGQTDRLAALQILSLLAFLSDTRGWGIDFLGAFLWWVAIASTVTVALRMRRHFKSAAPAA
jgi:phosphatidylglycerophosphate synthase